MTLSQLTGDKAETSRWFAAVRAANVRRCACGCNREVRPGDALEVTGHGLVVLADCYYAVAGELIETHPIGPGRRVRSACVAGE
jgi:hypothetical protein